MPRESPYSQELDVLEDKRSEGVSEGNLLLFSFFYRVACYSFSALYSLIRDKTDKGCIRGGPFNLQGETGMFLK